MSTQDMKPEHMRAPDKLSKEQIEKSLDELDSKIKTLKAKVNATTADSTHHYHEHIATLEAKRERIKEKLNNPADETPKGWVKVEDSIQELKNNVDKFFD